MGCFRHDARKQAAAQIVQVSDFLERIRVLGHVIFKDDVRPTQSHIKSV